MISVIFYGELLGCHIKNNSQNHIDWTTSASVMIEWMEKLVTLLYGEGYGAVQILRNAQPGRQVSINLLRNITDLKMSQGVI